MARMLVRDFFKNVGLLLKDLSPQFKRWTEDELVLAANDGQRAIAKYVPIACSRVDAVKLQPGTRQSIAHIPAASIIPGDGSTPADVRGLVLNDVIRNMGSAGAVPGAAVTVVSRESLDAISRMWHAARAAKSIDHYTYDPTTPQFFYVTPPVPADGLWVEINLCADPDPIPMPSVAGEYAATGSSTRTLSIDDRWADDLLHYVLARCWMKDAEEAANMQNVQLYTGLFTQSLNAQVTALTGQNPNLRTLPFSVSPDAAAS